MGRCPKPLALRLFRQGADWRNFALLVHRTRFTTPCAFGWVRTPPLAYSWFVCAVALCSVLFERSFPNLPPPHFARFEPCKFAFAVTQALLIKCYKSA